MPALVERLVELISTELPLYEVPSAVTAEDLRRSCTDNLNEILHRLAGHEPSDSEAPVATGRRRAERGFPLAGVLHAPRCRHQRRHQNGEAARRQCPGHSRPGYRFRRGGGGSVGPPARPAQAEVQLSDEFTA
jgi:hypothetical protein